MVVAKRQGGEKPTKIEQRKVKGRSKDGPRTGVRTSGRTALLASPICIGKAQGEGQNI